jgi:hypothetical protein
MAKYRKKPIIVEAVQWLSFSDTPNDSVTPYTTEQSVECQECGRATNLHGWIKTKEGGHIVCPRDWIITGVVGEEYPCKPDIFEQTYELVKNGEV